MSERPPAARRKPEFGRVDDGRVEKPWGYELRWATTERYAGKVLHVRKGEALSLQYHERKDEFQYVVSGEVEIELGESGRSLVRHRLGPGDTLRITPGTRHRLTALADTEIFEVSSPELDDVVRLEDRYGRA
jgi:mannose-6-phosphate isomerase